MAWERYLELIINVSTRRGSPIVSSLSNLTPVDITEIVSHDTFPLRLRFVRETGVSTSPLESVRLPETSVVIFAGKSLSNLGAVELLYAAIGLTEVEDALDAGKYYYEGLLNTNTEQLDAAISALTGQNRILQTVADIEIQNADNTQRTTFQHNVHVKRQVYGGMEGGPADANPAWPLPANILTKTNRLRIAENGDLELYNTDLDTWVRLTITGNTPQLTLDVL